MNGKDDEFTVGCRRSRTSEIYRHHPPDLSFLTYSMDNERWVHSEVP